MPLTQVNCLFGKTIQSSRKFKRTLLTSSRGRAIKHALKPTCVAFKVYADDFVGIFKRHVKLALNYPLHIGFSVLEKAKLSLFQLVLGQFIIFGSIHQG